MGFWDWAFHHFTVSTAFTGVVMFLLLNGGRAWLTDRTGVDPFLWLTTRFRFKRKRYAVQAARSLGAAVIVLAVWGLLLLGEWAFDRWFAPHEGDEANEMVQVSNPRPVGRDKKRGVPPGVTVTFEANEPIVACERSVLFGPTQPDDEATMDDNFRVMVGWLDLVGHKTCGHLSAGKPWDRSAYIQPPEFMSDEMFQQAQSGGQRILYALFVWEYISESNPKDVYVQEACFAYLGDFSSAHDCPGNHARTYRHLVAW